MPDDYMSDILMREKFTGYTAAGVSAASKPVAKRRIPFTLLLQQRSMKRAHRDASNMPIKCFLLYRPMTARSKSYDYHTLHIFLPRCYYAACMTLKKMRAD